MALLRTARLCCVESKSHVIVCGGGPASMGIFLQAAKRGKDVLDRLLAQGVTVVERGEGPWGSGKLGSYLIEANTPVEDCLAVVTNRTRNEHPLFEEARNSTEYRQVMATAALAPDGKAPLHEIGTFFGWLGKRLESELSAHPRCAVLYNTNIHALCVGGADGSVHVLTGNSTCAGDQKPPLVADCAVLALGGRARKLHDLHPALEIKAITSDKVQSRDGLAEAIRILDQAASAKRQQQVVPGVVPHCQLTVTIVGSSHSAFSTARLLLDTVDKQSRESGGKVGEEGTHQGYTVRVEMCAPWAPRVYFKSVDEAEACAPGLSRPEEGSVCVASGQVNLFGGIRSPVRELWLDSLNGKEPRLSFRKMDGLYEGWSAEAAKDARAAETTAQGWYSGAADADWLGGDEVSCPGSAPVAAGSSWSVVLEQSDLIIPALGYESNLPQLFLRAAETSDTLKTKRGEEAMSKVQWALDPIDSQVLMDNATARCAMLKDGVKPKMLNNVFGIGLGYGLKAGARLGRWTKTVGEQSGNTEARADGVNLYHTTIGALVLSGVQGRLQKLDGATAGRLLSTMPAEALIFSTYILRKWTLLWTDWMWQHDKISGRLDSAASFARRSVPSVKERKLQAGRSNNRSSFAEIDLLSTMDCLNDDTVASSVSVSSPDTAATRKGRSESSPDQEEDLCMELLPLTHTADPAGTPPVDNRPFLRQQKQLADSTSNFDAFLDIDDHANTTNSVLPSFLDPHDSQAGPRHSSAGASEKEKSEEELQLWASTFAHWDIDGDGYLTVEDMYRRLNKHGVNTIPRRHLIDLITRMKDAASTAAAATKPCDSKRKRKETQKTGVNLRTFIQFVAQEIDRDEHGLEDAVRQMLDSLIPPEKRIGGLVTPKVFRDVIFSFGDDLTTVDNVEELMNVLSAFERVDSDGDGVLTMSELHNAVERGDLAKGLRQGTAGVVNLAKAMDVNCDGEVGLDEWLEYSAKHRGPPIGGESTDEQKVRVHVSTLVRLFMTGKGNNLFSEPVKGNDLVNSFRESFESCRDLAVP